MSDLLPSNATEQERAVAAVMSLIGSPDPLVREVWSPELCPSNVLPWLAWGLSVDQWDPAWTDDQKRASIRSALSVQKIKGTIGAVRIALGAIGIGARVVEWHRQQTPGDPFTYRLLLEAGANAATLEAIRAALSIVDRTKSLRSHLELIEVSAGTLAGPYAAAWSSVGTEITLAYRSPAIIAMDNEVVLS
jgi:phage tail P2-like protein